MNYASKSIRIESICNVRAEDIIYELHSFFQEATAEEEDMYPVPTHYEIICPNREVVSGELMEDLLYDQQSIKTLQGLKDLTQLSTINRFETFSQTSPSFIRPSDDMKHLLTGSWIRDYLVYASELSEEDQKKAIKYLKNVNEKMLKIPECDMTIVLLQSESVILKEFIDSNPDKYFEEYLEKYRTKKKMLHELMDNHGVQVVLCDMNKERLSNAQVAQEIIKRVYGG